MEAVSRRLSTQNSEKDNQIWQQSFPPNVESPENSVRFLERCLVLGTAMLLQSRGLLPATAFRKRSVTSICKCWAPDQTNETGRRLLDKLNGVTQALHLGYLKEFFIVVGTNENNMDEVEEVFCWSISYGSSGISAHFSTNDTFIKDLQYTGMAQVKEQTVELLARIRKLCRNVLTALPSNAFPSFRVTYVEGATPPRYQAPGFYRSGNLFTLNPKAQSLALGGVATKNHKTCLSVSSVYLGDELTAIDQLNVSLLNETTGHNVYSMLEQSFGAVVNIKEGEEIEEPRGDVSVSPAQHPSPSPILVPKRRKAAVPSEDTAPQNRKLRQKKPSQDVTKKTPKILTPGKSYRIDQVTPDRVREEFNNNY